MRAVFDRENQIVRVTLSHRNLQALLHKLEMPESARTLIRPGDGRDEPTIVVSTEADEVHYASREPGPMHPLTETFIRGRR